MERAPFTSSHRALSRPAAAGLFVLVLLVLVGAVVGAVWLFVAVVEGGVFYVQSESRASTTERYGACDAAQPWPCDAVPNRTVEAKFGRAIESATTVVSAEACPIAGVTGTAQIQVVLELAPGADPNTWLSLVGSTAPVADASSIPELAALGVTDISGGMDGFTEAYAGTLDGRTYVWAYKRL